MFQQSRDEYMNKESIFIYCPFEVLLHYCEVGTLLPVLKVSTPSPHSQPELCPADNTVGSSVFQPYLFGILKHIFILEGESKCVSCSWVNLPDQVWPPAESDWLWIPCLESAYSHGQSTHILGLLWATYATIKDPEPCFLNLMEYMHMCMHAIPEKMFHEITMWYTVSYFVLF